MATDLAPRQTGEMTTPDTAALMERVIAALPALSADERRRVALAALQAE